LFLRLRGGGGEEFFIINLATQQKQSSIRPESMKDCDSVYKTIAKILNLQPDQFSIKYKPGKKTALIKMQQNSNPFFYPDEKTFYYSKLTDYKDVSFTCSPNGFWKIDLLKLCHPLCQKLDELRKRQTIANADQLGDNVILTLAGLFILQKFFALKKNCWALIESKAMNALIKELTASGIASSRDDVQKLVDAFSVEFNVD
jgi:hypothetical protein